MTMRTHVLTRFISSATAMPRPTESATQTAATTTVRTTTVQKNGSLSTVVKLSRPTHAGAVPENSSRSVSFWNARVTILTSGYASSATSTSTVGTARTYGVNSTRRRRLTGPASGGRVGVTVAVDSSTACIAYPLMSPGSEPSGKLLVGSRRQMSTRAPW